MTRKAKGFGWVLAITLPVLAFAGCGGSKSTSTVTVTVTETAATETSETDTETSGTTTTSTSGDDVAMTASGFSQKEKTVSVGLVLGNRSDAAALNVQVVLNLIDGKGDLLATDTSTIPVIPADSPYYSGTQVFADKPGAVKRLEAAITVGDTSYEAYKLPKVSNVTLQNEPYIGLQATGELRNTLPEPLSSLAQITAVVYNSAGKVIGGGFTFPEAEVPPGSRISFTVGNGLDTIDPKSAASVQVSASNEGDFEAIPPR